MDENIARLAQQLQKDPAKLRSLMQSQDGQTLMRMLTQGDQGAGLQHAAQAAVQGDPGEMAEMVKRVMESPQGAALVERINKAVQK
jgi:ribonuclease D